MADDMLPQSNDQALPRTMALLPSGGPEQHNGEWNGVPALAQPAGPAGLELATFGHALRRHWLLSLGIGLACAAAAGLSVFFFLGEKYSASSFLKVEMQERQVMGSGNLTDRDRFDVLKNTQREMLLGRGVLTAALRKPEAAKIPAIQKESRDGDAPDWLKRRLSVDFPGKAEIMQVSFTCYDAKDAATLVNAIVDSYLTDVVSVERSQKRERLSKLETACADKDQHIRNLRSELKSLATINGIGVDSETMTQKQKLLLEELGLYRQELARREFETARFENELAAEKALLKNVDTAEVPEDEVDALLNSDPVARQYYIELAMREQEKIYIENAVLPGANKYAAQSSAALTLLESKYNKKLEECKKKVRYRMHSKVAADVIRLDTSLKVMTKQRDDLAKTVDMMRNEAKNFGGVNVDMEMLRSELKQSEFVLAKLNDERETVRIELDNAPRINRIETAEPPATPSNGTTRLAMTVMATLAAFFCPVGIVMFWDAHRRRINTADEVSKGLRLPVIGSVPLIPSRVIRQLGSPSKRYRSWHMRLTESVDGITARVLRKAELGQCRVIMVSSATGGEGKTTLATQLAMSLARSGRRIVLVDFDLRRPAFDEVFGVPLEPGVCELLRKQNTVPDLVHPSGTENLDVITAGRWDRHALASLSNGSAGEIFQQLRAAYDFVVIDTSPLLPVADARFVSQHVDSVVLSVLRDISQAPKIQAACDILAAFGVQSVEAVVTGASTNLYGRHEAYESTISA